MKQSKLGDEVDAYFAKKPVKTRVVSKSNLYPCSIAYCLENGLCDPECVHLEPYGRQYDLTAKCVKFDKELKWYDYWIAICGKQ